MKRWSFSNPALPSECNGLGSLANSLLPNKKESEENELEVFSHFVGNVKIQISGCFDLEEASTTVDSTVGFDNDSPRVTVYKLAGVSDSVGNSGGAESVYIQRVWFQSPWFSTCTGHC